MVEWKLLLGKGKKGIVNKLQSPGPFISVLGRGRTVLAWNSVFSQIAQPQPARVHRLWKMTTEWPSPAIPGVHMLCLVTLLCAHLKKIQSLGLRFGLGSLGISNLAGFTLKASLRQLGGS